MKKIRIFRLDGSGVSWHFCGKDPSNLKPWPKMSFLSITEAALANISTYSEKCCFFKASLSMFLIPSLKTRIVFLFPSDCSCASWKCFRNRSFSMVWFTDFLCPRLSRRFSYIEWSSNNLNNSFTEVTSFSMKLVSSTNTRKLFIFSSIL